MKNILKMHRLYMGIMVFGTAALVFLLAVVMKICKGDFLFANGLVDLNYLFLVIFLTIFPVYYVVLSKEKNKKNAIITAFSSQFFLLSLFILIYSASIGTGKALQGTEAIVFVAVQGILSLIITFVSHLSLNWGNKKRIA